jgi:hypothetical protein
MAFTGTSPANVGDYLNDRIAPNALGQLIGELDLLKDIPVVPTNLADINEKTQTVRVPKTGALNAVTRAPLDNVVDQALSTTKEDIVYAQEESTFVVDSLADDVLNEARFNVHIQDAIKAVSERIIGKAFVALGNEGGVSVIGTPNVTITYAVWVQPKRELTNNKISKAGRIYYISPQSMEAIMGFTEYEGLFGFHAQKQAEEVMNLAGFTVRESVYLESLAPGIRNIAIHAPSAAQVFAPQKPITLANQVKRTATTEAGYTISILIEPVPGTNGASRVTVSANYGTKLLRDEGAVYVDAT